jgi:hypothetical protein
MTPPDYTTYSLQDLRSVKKHIDRDRYPQRYELALEELERREPDDREPTDAASKTSDKAADKRANRIFWAIITGLIAIGIITVGLTSAKRNQEMQAAIAKSQRGAAPVRAAIEEAFAAESIQVKLDRSGSKRTLALTLTNAELSETSEEDLAESVAITAFKAYEKPRKLGKITVVFVTETKGFFSSESESGEEIEFSYDDLRQLLE